MCALNIYLVLRINPPTFAFGCVYLLAPIKPPSPTLAPPWPFETGIVTPLTLLPGYHSSVVVASSSGMGMVVLLCESLCWATKSGRALPEGSPTLARYEQHPILSE